jgi:hypothetical protein
MIPPRALHILGQLSRRAAVKEMNAALADPRGAQRACLRRILEENVATEFGRAAGFAEILGARDLEAEYRRRVPLSTPESVFPLIERMRQGEPNVLVADAPEYWVRTTGSTGAPKHVAITDGYRREFQRTVHVALWHLYRRFPQAFTGHALYFVGSPKLDVSPDGKPVGTMSGYNFTRMPPIVRALYAWPVELFAIADLPTRSWLALHLALIHDVTLIAGIFPASIVYLLRDLEELLEELADHVARGTLPERLVLTDAERAFFAAKIRARPDVGARLTAARALPRGERRKLLFPRLALVYCWTSSTAGAFVPELQEHLGPDVPIRDAIYSACEGWCSIPTGEPEPGGLLAITSHFFELIPEAAYEAGARDTILPHEAETGGRYLIVFSTAGGLYRYVLGDVVEVYGRQDPAGVPLIRFVRKVGAFANLVGEKLDESHAVRAIAHGAAALAITPTFAALAPQPRRPGYALYLELPPGRRLLERELETLAETVDDELGRQAADYGRLRKGRALLPIEVKLVEPGAYRRFRQQRVLEGVAEPQIKVAQLVSEEEKIPEPLRQAARRAPASPGAPLRERAE